MKKSVWLYPLLLVLLVMQGCAAKQTYFTMPSEGIVKDSTTGQMWQLERSKMINSFDEARRYAENLRLGGYDDWRLPTIYELYDLNYLFDLHMNGDITLEREGNFWSGEKDGDGMIGAWAISDQCEPSRQYEPGKAGYVRAVRP